MPGSDALDELLALCRRLGITVRIERFQKSADRGGGICRLHGERCIVLDRNAGRGQQATAVAEAVAGFEFDASTLGGDSRMLISLMRRRHRRWRRNRPGAGDSRPSQPGIVDASPRRGSEPPKH